MNCYNVRVCELGESAVGYANYRVRASKIPHAKRLARTAFATQFGVAISSTTTLCVVRLVGKEARNEHQIVTLIDGPRRRDR